MSSRTHNPERRAWRGRSYKKHGELIHELIDLVRRMADKIGEDSLSDEGFHDLYEEAQELLGREGKKWHYEDYNEDCKEFEDGDDWSGHPGLVTCQTCLGRMPKRNRARRG